MPRPIARQPGHASSRLFGSLVLNYAALIFLPRTSASAFIVPLTCWNFWIISAFNASLFFAVAAAKTLGEAIWSRR